MSRKRIGLLTGAGGASFRSLADAFSKLFPVEFETLESFRGQALDALIVLNGDLAAGLTAAESGLPAYVVLEGTGSGRAAIGEVVFSSAGLVDRYLRARTMSEEGGCTCAPLAAQPGDEILASKGGLPVWLARPAGAGVCQIAALLPPAIGANEFLFQHLNGRQFLRLLPLLSFVRHVVREVDWVEGNLPACFVFDDPSLYRPSYGFLDFRHLASHASRHNYYAAIATVPFDTWRINSVAAEIFRSHHPRLSLLIHGNDHTSQELLFRNNGASRLAVAAQALRRMDRLKGARGLSFANIMEAPHGAVAREAFDDLLALGYQAALGTPECLVRHNPHAAWPAELGMDRSEMLGAGLPVLPRIRMSAQWKNDVLIASLLRQPIILAGHHNDAAGELELLAQFAGLVNSLGNVTWASPLEMVASNYKQIREGDALHLKLYSRAVRLRVPENVSRIFVHRPWLGENVGPLELTSGADRQLRANAGALVGPISVSASATIELTSPPPNPVDYRTVPSPRPRIWPAARKILMETRDRSMPWRREVAALLRRRPSENLARE